MKKSNWAVGECYRINAGDPRTRNIHDPHNQYRWADDRKSPVGAVLEALRVVAGAVCMFTLFWVITTLVFIL